MMMMKKLMALAMVCMLALTCFAFAEGDGSVAKIVEKGTLILGLDDTFPPMGFRDEDNNIVGFDIDVALEVASRLGVELVAQPISWDAKELELSSGNIDCIWNGLSITEERQASMSMSFPYLNNQIVVYVKADSGIATLDDLAGKVLGVQNGSYALELLEGDFSAVAEASAEVLGYDDYLTALMDLRQGGCDAVLMDLVVGDYYITGMGADDITPVCALEDDLYGIAFRKEDVELCAKVEEILIEMKKDGTLAAIAEGWFGSDITVVPVE